MMLERVNNDGLVLLGCGKMGSAMLQGWLARGLNPKSVVIHDPYPSDWVQSLVESGVSVNGVLPDHPAVCILAVKPQMIGAALPQLQALGNGSTVFISIAAGVSLAALEDILGADRRASDLLCMSKLAHASKLKEHDDNDDFQGITGRAA